MKFTESTHNAIKALLYMAQHGGRRILAEDLAIATKTSYYALSKTLPLLAKSGLVRSKRGEHGGYRLSKSPTAISILDVFKAIEGVVVIYPCVLGKRACGDSKPCVIASMCKKMNDQICKTLSELSIHDLNHRDTMT